MTLTIAAFDLSLACTGYATDGDVGTLEPPKECGTGPMRLGWIRDQVIGRAADVVVIEGYGFAPGRGHSARQLAELGGVIRLALTEARIPYAEIPPACLKLYAAGKGNAKKEAVLAEAIRRLGYQGSDNNEADALWLYAMALEHYGSPLVDMPKAHRAALTKIKWPDLAVPAAA